MCRFGACARNRLHSIGERLSETIIETSSATLIVMANSFSSRPTIPPMNSTGMNTATSEIVIDTIVKETWREPWKAASIGRSPSSMCRTMFSSMTIASSTTNPTDSVRAISERLSTLKPSRYITANVPTSDIGIARLGISVARRFRRNRKITRITSPSVSTSVNFTSSTDARIDAERSYSSLIVTHAGSCSRNDGSRALTALTTATVFVPGCRWIASTIDRSSLNQAAVLLFSTLSITCPSASRRTGLPLRYATMSGL